MNLSAQRILLYFELIFLWFFYKMLKHRTDHVQYVDETLDRIRLYG